MSRKRLQIFFAYRVFGIPYLQMEGHMTDTDTPTVPITFRATETQVAQLHAAIPAHRRATGEDMTVSRLIRECVDLHLHEISGVK